MVSLINSDNVKTESVSSSFGTLLCQCSFDTSSNLIFVVEIKAGVVADQGLLPRRNPHQTKVKSGSPSTVVINRVGEDQCRLSKRKCHQSNVKSGYQSEIVVNQRTQHTQQEKHGQGLLRSWHPGIVSVMSSPRLTYQSPHVQVLHRS